VELLLNSLIIRYNKSNDGKPPRDFLSTIESQFLRLDSGLNNKCIADAGVVYTYERL